MKFLLLTLAASVLASGVAYMHRPSIDSHRQASVNVPTQDGDKAPKGNFIKLKEVDLSADRQVYIQGVIEASNSYAAVKQILDLGKSPEPIYIILNSPGGSVLDGAMVISAMEAAKGPVNTICVSMCASMAAMIHQYGTKRYMYDRSVLMFHPAAGGFEGTLDQMNSRLNLFKNYTLKLEQNVARRSGISWETYKAKSLVELWIDAEDSLSQGFADNIVYARGSNSEKLFNTLGQERVKIQDTEFPAFYWISPAAIKLYNQTIK